MRTARPEETARGVPSTLPLLALAVLALAMHAPFLRGEATPAWTLLAAQPPWNDPGGPSAYPNPLADADPLLLELPEALHQRRSGGARWNPYVGLGEPC